MVEFASDVAYRQFRCDECGHQVVLAIAEESISQPCLMRRRRDRVPVVCRWDASGEPIPAWAVGSGASLPGEKFYPVAAEGTTITLRRGLPESGDAASA